MVSPLFTPLFPFPEMPDPQAISYSFEILVVLVDLLTHTFKRVISNCKEGVLDIYYTVAIWIARIRTANGALF